VARDIDDNAAVIDFLPGNAVDFVGSVGNAARRGIVDDLAAAGIRLRARQGAPQLGAPRVNQRLCKAKKHSDRAQLMSD